MVRYKHILKAIEQETRKHQTTGTNISAKLEAVMDNFPRDKFYNINRCKGWYDKDGNELKFFNAEYGYYTSEEIIEKQGNKDLKEQGLTDLHHIKNKPLKDMEYTTLQTTLAENDYAELKELNDNYEYLNRSISVVSPNGSRMTIIRNNDFSPEDYDTYDYAVRETLEICSDYEHEYFWRLQETATHLARENLEPGYTGIINPRPYEKQATEIVNKTFPSLETFMKQNPNYLDETPYEMFRQANCKLITKKPHQ